MCCLPVNSDVPVAMNMTDLKERLDLLKEIIPPGSSILYVDYPFHPNVGDLLIMQGTEVFFAQNKYKIRSRVSYHDFHSALPEVHAEDVFVFHGGGNMGDLYPEHVNLLLEILARFPTHRVVVLPQTVHFNNDLERDRIGRIFAESENLHFVSRDQASRDILSKYSLAHLYMLPDMAHLLFGILHASSPPNVQDLYLLRQDEEVGFLPLHVLDHQKQFVDWKDELLLTDRLRFAIMKRKLRVAIGTGIKYSVHVPWSNLADSMVKSGIRLISSGARIHTNRLHAMLLSALLGREVAAFDNNYGKLGGYYQTWLSDMHAIEFLGTDNTNPNR